MTVAQAPVGGFGGGLGGSHRRSDWGQDLSAGQNSVNNDTSNFTNTTQPYNTFGQSFLQPATARSATSTYRGTIRRATTSLCPATQYAGCAVPATASGPSTEQQRRRDWQSAFRLQRTRARHHQQGIVAQNANTAYNEYLPATVKQFGQLESALGNMFNAIGVGQTATGSTGVDRRRLAPRQRLHRRKPRMPRARVAG